MHWLSIQQPWYSSTDNPTLQDDPGSYNLFGRTCLLGLGSRHQGVRELENVNSSIFLRKMVWKSAYDQVGLEPEKHIGDIILRIMSHVDKGLGGKKCS